jgi:hypothetical protein
MTTETNWIQEGESIVLCSQDKKLDGLRATDSAAIETIERAIRDRAEEYI